MNARRCFFCVLFLSCIVLSLFALFMSLSFKRQIGFRIYSNLHGLAEYKHGIALLQCFKILVPFCPYFFRIFSGYFLWFVNALLSLLITIPIGCLFLIINVSSGLGITGYLLYPQIKSNQLIFISSSLFFQTKIPIFN